MNCVGRAKGGTSTDTDTCLPGPSDRRLTGPRQRALFPHPLELGANDSFVFARQSLPACASAPYLRPAGEEVCGQGCASTRRKSVCQDCSGVCRQDARREGRKRVPLPQHPCSSFSQCSLCCRPQAGRSLVLLADLQRRPAYPHPTAAPIKRSSSSSPLHSSPPRSLCRHLVPNLVIRSLLGLVLGNRLA